MNIIIMAVKIRMKRGETLEQALAHYPRLTEQEREEVRKAI